MKTIGWGLTLAMVATGCTNGLGPVELEPTGTGTVTDTFPTTDADGSGDDGPAECQSDADCDPYCGVCEDGQCNEYPGCCGAVPEGPNTWRCSPPPECWDDSECPPGQVCLDEWDGCVPEPESGLREPPLCGDEVTLLIETLPLERALTHVALHTGPMGESILLGASEDGLVVIDPTDGTLTPQLPRPAGELVDLQPAGAQGTLALMALDDQSYQLVRLEGPADGLQLIEGPVAAGAPGAVPRLAWVEATAEAVVTQVDRLDRWAPAPEPALLGSFSALPSAVVTTPVHATLGGPPWLGVSSTAGLHALDASTGDPTVDPVSLAGEQPAFMVAVHDTLTGGQHLATVSTTDDLGGSSFEPTTTFIQMVRNLQEPALDEPFGFSGEPLGMTATDVDGDGVEDLVVAWKGDHLDIYRMHETDVLCRSYLYLRSGFGDIERGDIDGDGTPDVIVVEGAALTIIHGQGVR